MKELTGLQKNKHIRNWLAKSEVKEQLYDKRPTLEQMRSIIHKEIEIVASTGNIQEALDEVYGIKNFRGTNEHPAQVMANTMIALCHEMLTQFEYPPEFIQRLRNDPSLPLEIRNAKLQTTLNMHQRHTG